MARSFLDCPASTQPTSLIDDDELDDKKTKEEADGFYGLTDCQLFDFSGSVALRRDSLLFVIFPFISNQTCGDKNNCKIFIAFPLQQLTKLIFILDFQ